MDATAAAVLRQPMGFPSSCYFASSSKELRNYSSGSVMVGRRRPPACEILSYGFCDQGHLQYYYNSINPASSAVMMSINSAKQEKAQKKMKKKKQLKLLKGLSRDLSNFSQMGFGLDSDGGALIDQVKGDMLSEAAELLLQRLQKLRAEEKELKRKMKEEKARLKAAQMQNNCEMSSGSSSSESSSDSDCGEVVNMNNLKRAQNYQNTPPQTIEETTISPSQPEVVPAGPALRPNAVLAGPAVLEEKTGNLGQENVSTSVVATTCCKKIEVCMGGKCKKSGGPALLEEFQRVVGIEGAVSGCKCMGKCRDGPNVKVLNGGVDDNSVRIAPNSLCIGVGLEDVDMIVASFLGENQCQLGFAAAC